MTNTNWQEFFEKLGTLLNEYHLMMGTFRLGVSINKRIQLVKFISNGEEISPEYYIPDDIKKEE